MDDVWCNDLPNQFHSEKVVVGLHSKLNEVKPKKTPFSLKDAFFNYCYQTVIPYLVVSSNVILSTFSVSVVYSILTRTPNSLVDSFNHSLNFSIVESPFNSLPS